MMVVVVAIFMMNVGRPLASSNYVNYFGIEITNDEYKKEIRIWRRRFLEDEDFGPRLKAVPFDNPVFQDCLSMRTILTTS